MRYSSSDLLNAVQLFTRTIIIILHKVPTTQRHLTDTRGKMETLKYLKKSYYHHIKCIVPTFMAAFMWSRPLNSVSWEITTQKKLKKKFNGTNTQVVAWMMNKCRGRMVQEDYIMGNIFHKKGIGKKWDFWHYWKRIKKLKRRKVSSDKGPINYHVHYSFAKCYKTP